MSNEQQTKTCSECCEPMNARAHVCPHCGRLQWRNAWPRMMIGFVPVLAICVAAMVWSQRIAHRFESGANPQGLETYAGQIKVTDSRMEFGQSPEGPVVLVVGMMKNDSDIPWEDVAVVAQFYDPQGRRIDVSYDRQYLACILPHGEMAFKLRAHADLPRESYARYEVSVPFAEDTRRAP